MLTQREDTMLTLRQDTMLTLREDTMLTLSEDTVDRWVSGCESDSWNNIQRCVQLGHLFNLIQQVSSSGSTGQFLYMI